MKLPTSKTKLKKKQLPTYICGIAVAGIMGLASCSSGGSQEYVEETQVQAYTQGVITSVEETEKDLFKITDETVVPQKEDSRIIANYMDGAIDTFTLDEVQLVNAEDSTGTRRRSGVRSAITGGLLGYYLGRSFSSPTNRSSYKSADAYNKSQTSNSKLRSTAKTTTVRKPASGSSGYGGSKSTRSYGG